MQFYELQARGRPTITHFRRTYTLSQCVTAIFHLDAQQKRAKKAKLTRFQVGYVVWDAGENTKKKLTSFMGTFFLTLSTAC